MKLFHLDWELSRQRDEENHFALVTGMGKTEGLNDKYRKAMEDGLYCHVADIDGDDLNHLYAATNNGVISPSWSRQPPEGVWPTLPRFHLAEDGKEYGRRSTSVGDIAVADGRMHVVAVCGFLDIGPVEGAVAAPGR